MERNQLDPKAYHNLLKELANEGEPWGKTASVYAYKVPENTRVMTLKSDGTEETGKLTDNNSYVVFDPQHHDEKAQKDIVRQIFKEVGEKSLDLKDVNSNDYEGPGVWTSRAKNVENDYIKHPSVKGKFFPNPEATRICVKVKEDITMPVQWGEFDVDKGGDIAIRKKDMPQLIEALAEIENGKDVKEVLYDDKGNAKFDIYGMEPGFLEKNYNNLNEVRKSQKKEKETGLSPDVVASIKNKKTR